MACCVLHGVSGVLWHRGGGQAGLAAGFLLEAFSGIVLIFHL